MPKFLRPSSPKNDYATFIENERARDDFIRLLETLEISPILLADDKRIYSDQISLEIERTSSSLNADADSGIEASMRFRPPHVRVKSELKATLERVGATLLSLTLGGQRTGFSSAHVIYFDVLKQLASLSNIDVHVDEDGQPSNWNETDSLLASLTERSPRFAEFDLVPPFDAAAFAQMLGQLDSSRRKLAQNIVSPYLTTLRKQYDALEEAESLIRTLLLLINRRLAGKSVTYSPRRGLQVKTDDDVVLDPDLLSSGERQLVMLLCTALLARSESKLLIIDEPELSLGLEWQREILDDLLALTSGTGVQFIVATHSVEVITGQRKALVRIP